MNHIETRKQYIEGETYIIFVRLFGLPASDDTCYYVRAKCIGGNGAIVGHFEDARGYRFHSSVDDSDLESRFVQKKEVIDTHPYPYSDEIGGTVCLFDDVLGRNKRKGK